MKSVYKILFILFVMISFVVSSQAQISSFRAFRETKGVVTPNSKDVYVWGPWLQSSAVFVLNIPERAIYVEYANNQKSKFEIFDKPDKWSVKKNYKYILFECMESKTLEKYYFRLCEYDTGEFKITIMTPKTATRYQVIYVRDNESVQINYDDIEDD